MIIEENEEYSVIVPDYLLESETENAESSVDYSETLSDIVINQQSTNDLLEEIISNQETIISSQNQIYSGIHFVSNLSIWVVIVSGALFFGRYFKSIIV